MVHRVPVKAKGVTINDNRELVLMLLDESLKVHGLKEPEQLGAATLLIPQAEENAKSMLKRLVGKAEDIGFFKIGATGKVLAEDVAEMDDVGERLLQEITNDWIDAICKIGMNASDMEKFELNSMRVLISEIYIRLVISALRLDNKLAPTKNREVWVNVMQTFVEKIKDPRYKLGIEKVFDDQIKIIHVRWVQCIRAVVSQLEEVQKAKTTITNNLEFMKVHQMQVMRFLVVAIYGKKGAGDVPQGSLAPRQIWKTVENCYQWKIKQHTKKHNQVTLVQDKKVMMLSGEEKKKGEIELLQTQEMDVAHELMGQQELILQNTILSISDDNHVRHLIGLLNWTRVIIGLIDRIDRVVNLGGWVPILLNMMDFEEVDRVIDNYLKIFNKVIDQINDQYGITGTELYRELGKYVIEGCRYDRGKIQKMKDLQSEELLERIRDKLSDAYLGVMRFGKALNCKIVPIPEGKQSVDVKLFKASDGKTPLLGDENEKIDRQMDKVSIQKLTRLYREVTTDGDASGEEEKKRISSSSESPGSAKLIDKFGLRFAKRKASQVLSGSLSSSDSAGFFEGEKNTEEKVKLIEKNSELVALEYEELSKIFEKKL